MTIDIKNIITLNKKTILKLACLACLLLNLSQCGSSGDNPSKDVIIKIIPEKPTIINADLTLRPGTSTETKIAAPWFPFRFRVKNESTKGVVIVTFEFEVSISKDGSIITETITIDPANAILAPLVTLTDAAENGRGGTGAVAPNGGDFEYTDNWFIFGLPEGDNFRYSVVVTPLGWFEDDEGVPQERLEQSTRITTQ